MSPRPRATRAVFIMVSIVLGTVAALGSATLVLRWRRPAAGRSRPDDVATIQQQLDRNPKALYVYDDETSYRLKPLYKGFRWGSWNTPHETNSRGLLGSSEIDPSSDVHKVIFLGDSVTYGDAVPYATAFVTLMQTTAGPGWQLMNAGTPGWSTYQELHYYDRFLWDIPWRAVVIVFCLNDLVKFEWVWRNEREFEMTDELAELDGLRGLTSQTAKAIELASLRRSFRARPATAPLASLNSAALRAWSTGDWRDYANTVLEPWLRTHRTVPVMIVLAPVRDQLKALALGAPRRDVLKPQQEMRSICERMHVECLDPIDAIRAAKTTDEADELYRDELHLTEHGHAVFAAWLWPHVRAFAEQQARSAPR